MVVVHHTCGSSLTGNLPTFTYEFAIFVPRPTPVPRELPPWELDRETEEELDQRKGVC